MALEAHTQGDYRNSNPLSPAFPFPIIDPHIHQWDLRHTPRGLTWPHRLLGWSPWLYRQALVLGIKPAQRAFLGRPDFVMWDYLPADYVADMGALPIEQVVHVESEWRDRSVLGSAAETRWLDRLFPASGRPQLGGIVAQADLRRANVKNLLDAHYVASSKLRGIRQILAFDTDDTIMHLCDQPGVALSADFWRGLERLQDYSLSLDVWVFHHQLHELAQLAGAFPDQAIVLEHMGTPIGLGGPFASYGRNASARDVILKTWQYGLAELAECPNVAVKLSGLFMPVVGWGFEHRSAPVAEQELLDAFLPHASFVLEQFGVDRCLFASNFPLDKVSVTLQQLYQLYGRVAETYSEAEQRKLFADNARRLYRLG